MLDERIGRLQDIARSRETALEACRKTSQDCSSYEEDAGKVHLAASDAVIAINHHMKANHSEEEKEFLRIN